MTRSDRLKGWLYRWCPQNPKFNISKSDLRYIQILPWITSVHAIRIFVMIFTFALVSGTLNGFSPYSRIYIESIGLRVSDMMIQLTLLETAKSLLLPTMAFIASYFAGRRLNIETEMKPIIVYLILGCFIGNFMGYLAVNIALFSSIYLYSDKIVKIFLVVFDSFSGGLSSTFTFFFISFSGIAMASLRNMQGRDETHPPENGESPDDIDWRAPR